MKLLERIRMLSGVQILLLTLFFMGFLHTAQANIFSYIGSNGTVNLSNVPADGRYTILVPVQVEQSVAAAATDRGKPSLLIASKVSYDIAVDEVARAYGLESALLHAVISVESRYRPKAVSKKGAAGLMQLMPAIARRYGVTDPLDPLQNLHGGAKHLRDLLKIYNNDTNLALAAYNAGQGSVRKYGNRIPPFRETKNYVPRVLDFYRRYRTEGHQANMPGEYQASRY